MSAQPRTVARPRRAAAVFECDVRPRPPYRLPGPSRDGLLRRDGDGLVRLLHHGERPVVVRARPAGGCVRLVAVAETAEAARWGAARMRFALGLDEDLEPFRRAFARDPLLGPAIRRRPWLRPERRPVPFEALAWAVCEQLIESERAVAIERRIVRRYGRALGAAPAPEAPGAPPPAAGVPALRDAPCASTLAARAPAELAALDLAPKRAIALVRAAREVAAGRADLEQHEPCWRRLRAIPEIGAWTLECLALHGQGRDDQLPAGDLVYIKLVGRLAGLGRRASVEEVREFFAPYAPYQALAGLHLLLDRHRLLRGAPPPWVAAPTRWSRSA